MIRKNIEIPDNIHLLRIPPYSPELNPAEKVWQWMKQEIAMKFFDTIDYLKKKITTVINQMDPERIKTLANNDLYTNIFFE